MMLLSAKLAICWFVSLQVVSSFQLPLSFSESYRVLGGVQSNVRNHCTCLTLQSENDNDSVESFYFVREAVFADLGAAASILTEGFFSESTNFITYQVERLKTYLSLESTYPDPINRGSHEMIVACLNRGAKVVGFAEMDCRESNDPKLPPRPYMCNLAVDKQWQRAGIATALVKECESKAIEKGKDSIFLKVRERNSAATSMYKSMGYVIAASSQEEFDVVLLMKKDLGEATAVKIPVLDSANQIGTRESKLQGLPV